MITKDDEAIFSYWMERHASWFDQLVILDGSSSNITRELASRYENILYFHEKEVDIKSKDDQGLRHALHEKLKGLYATPFWVLLCHPDEFYYHDPRKLLPLFEEEGADLVQWNALQVLPHPTEKEAYAKCPEAPAFELFHHFYHFGTHAFKEFRLFLSSEEISYFEEGHGRVYPEGLHQVSSFHPTLLHYKVLSLDPDKYEENGNHLTHFAEFGHTGIRGQYGEGKVIRSSEDFFTESYFSPAYRMPYSHCDYFGGVLTVHNMGEEFVATPRILIEQ